MATPKAHQFIIPANILWIQKKKPNNYYVMHQPDDSQKPVNKQFLLHGYQLSVFVNHDDFVTAVRELGVVTLFRFGNYHITQEGAIFIRDNTQHHSKFTRDEMREIKAIAEGDEISLGSTIRSTQSLVRLAPGLMPAQ